VVHEYFPAVLSLAETLLRSPEPVITHFASAIYRHAFLTFDVYGRQVVTATWKSVLEPIENRWNVK